MYLRIVAAALVGLSLISLTGTGCDSSVADAAAETASEAPRRFSWVVDNQLAGMAHPGYGQTALATYDYLAQSDVTLLVSLTETAPTGGVLSDLGIDHHHLPVVDYTAPSLAQLDRFVGLTATELLDGGRVAVHCAGGQGRTGTFLAAWFVAVGMSAEEAIDHVRTLRPGSIETAEQLAIIAQYAQVLDAQVL